MFIFSSVILNINKHITIDAQENSINQNHDYINILSIRMSVAINADHRSCTEFYVILLILILRIW